MTAHVSLSDRVLARGALGPDEAARLLLPVADSLTSVHAVSGVHTAISPGAIHIDPAGRATLLDRTQVYADPAYTAPEEEDPELRRTPAADVWSLAAVLRFATTGEHPPFGQGPPRRECWLSPIAELALQADPRERPAMAEVADYLRARVAEPRTGEPDGGAAPWRPRAAGNGARVALLGAAAVVVLGLLGGLLLLTGGRGDLESTDAPNEPASTASSDGAGATTEPTADAASTATLIPHSAAELEQFARDYVTTASRQPDAGFQRLTPAYQQESTRYHDVWSAIDDPEILAVSADPEALSVTYTYRYRMRGNGTRTEEVTLRLIDEGGRLLIAGGSARPL